MRLLLTNDDGINAPGLAVLERIAHTLADEVWVVAPESDQSGLAHSLTLNEPLRLRKLAERKFALKGTPTDCVIMGVRELMQQPPDFVLSGINSGQNIGDDVTYSGTVAGAMEGTLLGIPSIAISQAYNWDDGLRNVPWQTCETLASDILKNLFDSDFPARTFLNLNFPNCSPEAAKPLKITRQGFYGHGLHLEKRRDGRHIPYYWLRFGRTESPQLEESDIAALRSGHISLTPLRLDWTDDDYRQQLEQLTTKTNA